MKRLLVGYKSPELTPALLEGDATVHELDIYHAHAVEKAHPGVRVVCSPHLPDEPWDEIFFKTGPKLMSGELSLDLLQECHQLLSKRDATSLSLQKNPRFRLDFVGRERDRNDLLDKISDDPKRVRKFAATWPASVPGGSQLMFTSFPGCFCHRRQDEGGLALAEVVSRELLERVHSSLSQDGRDKRVPPSLSQDGRDKRVPPSLSQDGRDKRVPPSAFNLLDMGCGCGLVGLLIADRLKNDSTIRQFDDSAISLTLIDSHARAVEAATLNARAFGLEAEVLLADDGLAARPERDGTYDVFVGNPPYYSDYRIAEVFLETARRALRSGGVCYTVVKNDAGLKPVQERYFPSVAVIRRRGYCVLKSVKP